MASLGGGRRNQRWLLSDRRRTGDAARGATCHLHLSDPAARVSPRRALARGSLANHGTERAAHGRSARPPAPRAETTPAVASPLRKQGGGGGGGGAKSMGFGSGRSGSPRISDGERDGLLRLAPSTLSAPVRLRRLSFRPTTWPLPSVRRQRDIVTTAIFDAFDNLIQPAPEVLSKAGEDELRCFFALVDRRSYDPS